MFRCFTNADFTKLYKSLSPEADITTLRRQTLRPHVHYQIYATNTFYPTRAS